MLAASFAGNQSLHAYTHAYDMLVASFAGNQSLHAYTHAYVHAYIISPLGMCVYVCMYTWLRVYTVAASIAGSQ